MKKINLFVILFSLLITNNCFGQDNKDDNIETLLNIMGVRSQYVDFVDQYVKLLKNEFWYYDDVYWNTFKEVFIEEIDTIYTFIIPLYAKYFSEIEITELIEFYNSPIGVKLLEVSPSLTQESMQIGAEWGKSLQNKMLTKLEGNTDDKKIKRRIRKSKTRI